MILTALLIITIFTSCNSSQPTSPASSKAISSDISSNTSISTQSSEQHIANLDDNTPVSPKIGLFHVAPSTNLKEFDKVVKYEWVNCFILEGSELRLLKYALKKIKEQKKTAFIYMNIALTDYRQLRNDWQQAYDKVVAAAKEENAWDDTVLGWFYDEPFLNSFTEDAFITATKYSREKYGKRCFAVFSTPEFDKTIVDIPQLKNRPTINQKNLAYVTDIGYDFYEIWGELQIKAHESFKKALGDRADTIITWYFPPIGILRKEWDPDQSEKYCSQIFENYFNFMKSEKRFGGVFLYTWEPILENDFTHGNGKKYLTPNDSGVVLWKDLYSILSNFGKDISSGKKINEIILKK
jgi:hypothetical protein